MTEIVSAHGSSEASDSPRLIHAPIAGNFVRELLGKGLKLGFIGSGDGHDGHPGLTRIASARDHGGLAALVGAEPTRPSVLETLRARSTYATSGPRIYLDFEVAGQGMGSELPYEQSEQVEVAFEIAAEAPIDRVEVIRSGRAYPVDGVGAGRHEWRSRIQIPALFPGESVYLRVVQQDRHAAWSSPVFCCAE